MLFLTHTASPEPAGYFSDGSGAHNSAVECHLHTVEVVGSNPAVPTIKSTTYESWQLTWCHLVPNFTTGINCAGYSGSNLPVCCCSCR